jgi:8-oxo-dGTP pyrophosphatase MutT (NUDIX family)
MDQAFEKRLSEALRLDIPIAWPKASGGEAAAVLVLCGWYSGQPSEPALLFVKRTETVEKHKGQIAFPGGRCEPGDFVEGDPFVAAALRETQEEVGIDPASVTVLGRLPELATLTGYTVTPVVGLISKPIESIQLIPQGSEVAEAFWMPISTLSTPSNYKQEYFLIGEDRYQTDVFWADIKKIWGVTGSILKNLLDRLANVK